MVVVLLICGLAVGAAGFWMHLQRNPQLSTLVKLPPQLQPERWMPSPPQRLNRPYGMAPVAFQAYVRACNNAGIHPFRVGQTIGNHPRSVGYHKSDGSIIVDGKKEEYCTAVDLGTFDLDNARIDRFLRELGRQGFAAWYRHGPRWKGGEHIHAVYAMLPMKSQLRGQVLLYLREQRKAGRRVAWERKMRRSRAWRKYL
jgi:hypothetical protein